MCYGAKAKEGTTSLMWVTSQEDSAVEIIHFERTGLNGLYPIEFFILNKGLDFRGREGISLLVYAYHSALSISLLFFLNFVTLIISPLLSFLS